jgi:AraC-like DNA-binding protein
MDRPLRLGFDGDFARTTLTFPRSSLQQRIGRLDDFIGRPLEGTRGIGGLLSPLLRKLPCRLNAMSATTRERIADNLLDMIATALVSISERPSLPPAMTLARVKLWIERHLGEELSAEDIAAGCGLSSRHLNRLFSREGTSLMQFVWERRLARCHRNLTDPAMRGRSITEIAFAAGFNDPSHFSRSYRAHYGCAPSVSRATCSAS